MYADFKTTELLLKGLWNTRLSVIGKSVFRRNIYAVGFGSEKILITAAIHAREHVTAMVLLRLLQYRLCMYKAPPHNLAFVPMVNPDGVELCLHGAESAPPEYRKKLLQINGGKDFSQWKANGRAVDLNLNFDALWGQGKGNLRYPSSMGYVGRAPLCEPESLALAQYAKRRRFEVTVSLHAKGGEVYAEFQGIQPDPSLSQRVSRALGYPLKKTEGSCGGFKDWYIQETGLPSFTVELGSEEQSYTQLYSDVSALSEKVEAMLEVLERYVGENSGGTYR